MIQEHGGNLREISRHYGVDEDAIVDFSSNSNPLGCPAAVRTIFRNGVSLLSSYPDIHCAELREALAVALGCGPQNIIAGNGSTELIYLIPRAFKPRRALILNPTFSEYEKSLLAAGCAVRSLPLHEEEQFRVSPREVSGLLSRVDMLFLCNPNNPTGVLMRRDALSAILTEAGKKGVLAVVDEAFVDFAPRSSIVGDIRRRKNLMVLRSMTKFYGIPGIRLGYLVGSSHLVRQLNRFKEPWTVNALAQKIGIACAADRKFAVESRRFIDAERDYLVSQLQSISGLQPWPSSANYVLLQITRGGLSSGEVYEKLAGQGILVRDCRSFKGMGNRFLRVAVKRRQDNRRLLAALQNVAGGG
jgi:threonine-phosphate decarboxylase